MPCHVMLYDVICMYVHGPMRPLSRIPTRSSPRTNSFLLTYPAYLSSLHCCNIFCFRSFPNGACHESSFFLRSSFLQSLALLRLLVISHWSFILFHVSGTSVQQYLLTINKTRGCYTRPSIFILHSEFILRFFCIFVDLIYLLHSMCSWVILFTANIAVCTPSFFFSPLRHLVIFLSFTLLRFFF